MAKTVQLLVGLAVMVGLPWWLLANGQEAPTAGVVFFAFAAVLCAAYVQEAFHRFFARSRRPKATPGPKENGRDLTPP